MGRDKAANTDQWARRLLLALPFCLLVACSHGPATRSPLETAEAFVDAFYAWDAAALTGLMAAGEDRERVLYYQGWAEAAHYQVQVRRPCELIDGGANGGSANSVGVARCAITVTDDFGQALGYTATDTFSLTVSDGIITAATFAGDDPPVFEAVFAWLAETRPEVFAGPCRAMFEGGDWPGDCARAIAEGARAFAELEPERR